MKSKYESDENLQTAKCCLLVLAMAFPVVFAKAFWILADCIPKWILRTCTYFEDIKYLRVEILCLGDKIVRD